MYFLLMVAVVVAVVVVDAVVVAVVAAVAVEVAVVVIVIGRPSGVICGVGFNIFHITLDAPTPRVIPLSIFKKSFRLIRLSLNTVPPRIF